MSCANCGSTREPVMAGALVRCRDCDWPVGMPVPDAPWCSICRRRHGPETTHACE
jgi:hypothetical protein